MKFQVGDLLVWRIKEEANEYQSAKYALVLSDDGNMLTCQFYPSGGIQKNSYNSMSFWYAKLEQ